MPPSVNIKTKIKRGVLPMSRKPPYITIFAARENSKEMAEYASDVWRVGLAHMTDNNLVTDARLITLDRYARAQTEYSFLYPVAMIEGPTLKSGNGGEYVNMKWAAVGKLNEQIMKFEASLLIAPQTTEGQSAGRHPSNKKTAADEYLEH